LWDDSFAGEVGKDLMFAVGLRRVMTELIPP